MLKDWPIMGEGRHNAQISWHLVRDHPFCIGLQLPSKVSKVKRGKFFSNHALMRKWSFSAWCALLMHCESV